MINVRFWFGLLAVSTACLHANTLYVCTSGAMEDGTPCTHSSLQAAINQSSPGDTIIARSGETFGRITIAYPKKDLVIKSSHIDTYPRNTRITRQHSVLAKIVTTSGDPAITIGSAYRFGTLSPGGTEVTFSSDHDYQIGDRVTLGEQLMSVYFCKEAGAAPFGAQCPAERVGFFNVRHRTYLKNGSVVFADAQELPSPLQRDTPYYVVNFAAPATPSSATPERFQLAETPDGPPLEISNYIYNKGLTFTVQPLPVRGRDALYVVATTRRTIRLSESHQGDPITFTQVPAMYNGTAGLPGVQVYRADAVRNITIDGFEITNAPATDPWQLVLVNRDWYHPDGMHSGIRILRSWIYGDDDQESMPHQGVLLSSRDSEVGWSIIENIYSTSADTQAIWLGNSSGNIDIHDNFLSATGESIMSGGNYPNRPDILLEDIRVRRNFFYKPLQWWNGIEPYRLDANTVGLRGRLNLTQCNSNQGNLSNRCLWYEGGNRTDLDNETWTRHELTETGVVRLNGVSGNGQMFIYGHGGQMHLRHNISNGAVDCPSFLDCQYSPKPTFPVGSSRAGIILVRNGQIDPNTYGECRPPWVKNALESKYGDRWSIEGNVFHRQFLVHTGGISQEMLINFAVVANGSSDGQPLNWRVSSSDSVIRNNIFRHAGKGIISYGRTFTSGGQYDRVEGSGLGRAGGNVVENNLMVDIGSQEWINHQRGGAFQNTYNTGWVWRHNTAVDIWYALIGNAYSTGVETTENVFVPYLKSNPARPEGVLPAVVGDSVGYWMQAIAGGAVKFDAQTSTFARNIVMNRNNNPNSNRGTNYPDGLATTYLVQNNDPDRDPSRLFENWQERDVPASDASGLHYRRANFRIKPSVVGQYPSYTGRTLGADIDEIEALTGPYGRDVERGIPSFAERTYRTINVEAEKAVIAYDVVESVPCMVRVWDNENYVGNPVVQVLDDALPVVEWRKSVTLEPLRPGKLYFGKRWCADAVDVFSFRTASLEEPVEIAEPLPQGATECSLSYGVDARRLEFTVSGIVSDNACKVSLAPDALFWSLTFRDGTGGVFYKTTVRRQSR